ncbi:MAG: large subunit ribosomal protein L21 [Pseudohongiellaceae bacterium]|jgi:large subunit ribosomal protein L21
MEHHNMYAVIKSGGKQHRVVEGETLKVEKIEVATGGTIQFDEVLLVTAGDDINIGTPFVSGAAVKAEIIAHGRGDKVRIIKFRRRKHSMTRQGHRQWFTEIKITEILATGAKAAPAKQTAAKPKVDDKPKTTANGVDDLGKLSGVGPVIVKKLNENGITAFAQIAAWTPEQVAELDEKLNFKGRIERDGWIAQATEFMKGE